MRRRNVVSIISTDVIVFGLKLGKIGNIRTGRLNVSERRELSCPSRKTICLASNGAVK